MQRELRNLVGNEVKVTEEIFKVNTGDLKVWILNPCQEVPNALVIVLQIISTYTNNTW